MLQFSETILNAPMLAEADIFALGCTIAVGCIFIIDSKLALVFKNLNYANAEWALQH